MNFADLNLDLLKFSEVKLSKGTTYIKPIYSIMDTDATIKTNMSLTKIVDLPLLRFPWINLSTFGVPPKGEYTKEDKQRLFIKVPIEDDSELYRQLKALDHKLKYEIIETKTLAIFGSGNNYEYEPLLRFNIKTGKAYIKVKLDTTFPDNHILTEVWCVKDDTKHQCQFDNIDDFALCVAFKSDIRMIVQVVKIWVINMKYGLTLKLKKVGVKPYERQTQEVNFLDD